MPLPITEVFADLPDPRRETDNKRHLLGDILTLAVCAVIGGAETWDAIAEYGLTKGPFFRRFLALPNGVPSPDTFARVFARLDPKAFADRFGRWMAQACQATGLIPVAVDGKSSRQAKKATAAGCLHTVSAWAAQGRLTLGQLAVPEGSNEIAVIPDLLQTLDLAGAAVAIDAAGCQKGNAEVIRSQGGTTCSASRRTSQGCTGRRGRYPPRRRRSATRPSHSTTTPRVTRGTAGARSGRWR
jgi:hypothetical protein